VIPRPLAHRRTLPMRMSSHSIMLYAELRHSKPTGGAGVGAPHFCLANAHIIGTSECCLSATESAERTRSRVQTLRASFAHM
jgi:hypothetical protein